MEWSNGHMGYLEDALSYEAYGLKGSALRSLLGYTNLIERKVSGSKDKLKYKKKGIFRP